jgi:small nuclear ribonucleoprotein (snRNP)-like protein
MADKPTVKLEPKLDFSKSEEQPGQYGHVQELLKNNTIELIGRLKNQNEDGDDEFRNVILTVHDGKIVYGTLREVCYTENDVINDATAWIDRVYYE